MNKYKGKKIAIVHDTYTYFGGAERVLLNLIKIFPEADIYTSLISEKNIYFLQKLTRGKIYYSKLSKLSWITDHPDIFKLYILLFWQNINLDQYDLVLSSSHSFCSNWVNVKGKHISYIHTPPKYLYGTYNETRFIKKFPFTVLFYPLFSLIRKINFIKVQKIDVLVAVSENIRQKIKMYYKRDSIIVHPSGNLPRINTNKQFSKNYYLFFSRLVRQKGIELAVRSFNENGKQLVVVGEGKEEQPMKKIAKNNIKFLGFLPDRELSKVFKGVRALVYCSIEEDFGLIPIEAMAHGVPVIAYKSGGVKETVIEGKTGTFFHRYSKNALNQTIIKFEKMHLIRKNCILQANKFTFKIFKQKILKVINSLPN